nr:deoxyribose-phosphate aldolase [Bacilli bacterium]
MIERAWQEEFIRLFGQAGENVINSTKVSKDEVSLLFDEKSLAKTIDHTLLKPEATPDQVKVICEEARQWHVASVCVNALYVPLVAKELAGSDVAVCSVVGFPLGAMGAKAKAFETAYVVGEGAQEIDMVVPIGMIKAGQWQAVYQDIVAVREAAQGKLLKVILETCLLTDQQKVMASWCSVLAEANYVKTSTGFSSGGAVLDDVALMKEAVGSHAKVKASGGIKTREEAIQFLQKGASRLGTSQARIILGKTK